MWKKLQLLFIIQFICGSLFAQNSPPITINETNISVGALIKEITKQSGLNFSYNAKAIDTEQVIDFSVKNASIEKTLELLSEKTNISFLIIEDQIVLNKSKTIEEEPEQFHSISGYISDEASGETLIGATVRIKGTTTGTSTNEFGYYVLFLESGKHQLEYSYVGYPLQRINLDVQKDKKQDVAFAADTTALPDVIVKVNPKDLTPNDLGQINLNTTVLNNMPEFGGESGLVKGLQTLPGVKMHSDGSAFFYTRGGDRDQNLIIIDDAPIYNPAHLFGFYSIVIPDFAKQIKVYKSDIPTNLGDRLSSIIDIRTKDGNLNKFALGVAFNPLLNRVSIETPFVKKRGSIFLSWRRSTFDWLYKRRSPNAELGFGDLNFKINYKINDKNRIFFTTIVSNDAFNNIGGIAVNRSGIRWGNFAMTLRLNHIHGPKLFSNTTIYTGNYAYRLTLGNNFWQSFLGTLSAKMDFTHYTSPKLTMKFGFETQAYFNEPGRTSIDTTLALLPSIETNFTQKAVLYYQANYDFSTKLKLKAGVRMISWKNNGTKKYFTFDENYEVADTINVNRDNYNGYFHIDPRLSLAYKIDKTSDVKFSFGRYHQYLQLISNSTSPFTSMEVWLPAGPYIKPQVGYQWALNYKKVFGKKELEWSTAIYYKKLKNQIDYEPLANTLFNPLLEGELRFGDLYTYGAELQLKKEIGKLTGWVSYTYSRAIRNTTDLNNGNNYPAFQDRPHDFSLMLNYPIRPRVLFSAYWTAFSGSTFSSPTGFFNYNGHTIPIYDEKNNDRLPAYRRMDIAFKFRLNKNPTARFQHDLTFSIYNLRGRKNVFAANFTKLYEFGERPVVQSNFETTALLTASQADLIRFFPSLTYKFNL